MNAEVLKNLVELFQKKQFTEVLKMAGPIIDQNPNDLNALNIFSASAAFTGQFQLAENFLKRGLAIDASHAELNNNLGNVLLRQEKYAESIKHFEQAIKTQPENSNFYNGLGAALLLLDRIKESEQILKTAMTLEPKNPDVHYNTGAMFWEKGCTQDAQECCLIALSLNPSLEKAKALMIRTFESHSPDECIDFPTVLANRKIRKINLGRDIKKRMSENNITKILEHADGILTSHDQRINYPKTQAYRRDLTRLNCSRHERIFNERGIIPKFCFGCFKVQVEPRTVVELIKLFLLFDWIVLSANNTRKCMVELRDGISGFYKGLIYCSSLDEAESIHSTISTYVSELIDPNVPCSIKRGCSEFAQAYPEYGLRDKTDAFSLMDYPNEWEAIENAYDADHYSDRPLQGAPTLKGFSLSDFLIIKNWIGYARGIGDPSVAGFSIQRIGSNRLLEPAAKRKAKLLSVRQSKIASYPAYNIKPITIS